MARPTARIDGVSPEQVEDDYVRNVLAAQARTWGAPLLNHLVYARRPSIFRGARGMWTGIDGSGLVDGRLQALLNRTASKPLTSQIAGQPADSAMLLGGVSFALYSKSFWQYLRTGLADAFAGNGTLMVVLADSLTERQQNGQYTNLMDAFMAVSCIDRPWPRPLTAWSSAAATAAQAAPQFGAANMWGSLPCAFWPVPAAAPVRLRAPGAPPILVVGTTRDPATPFRWVQALAGDLKSGVLLGWNGDGHTAYLEGSSCVDTAVDRYLISLATPRSGTICP